MDTTWNGSADGLADRENASKIRSTPRAAEGPDDVTSLLTARPPSALTLLIRAKARQTPILFSLRGGGAPSRNNTDTDTLIGKRKD